jgi:cell division protein FtsW
MGVLVIMEPDLGTAIFLAGITFVMLFLGGRKIIHLLYPIFAGIPILLFLIFASGNQYWKARLEAFVNPWKEPLGKGFQIIQSLIAIGSGGLFGRGLGESRQKFFYLPDRHTDFIFAIIGEELGFIGTIGVVILFCILFWRGWLIAVRSGDDFQAMLAMGIILSILMQVIVNMSAVLKILPVSGVPLPLVSYGNSSILITMIEIGLLFNIARQSKVNHFE